MGSETGALLLVGMIIGAGIGQVLLACGVFGLFGTVKRPQAPGDK